LLILNRLIFISKFESVETFKDLSISEISKRLKQKYPKVFIPSVLEAIADQSSLTVSSLKIEFTQDFFEHSAKSLPSMYLKVLDQRSRRKLGQFWTPEHIAEFMIELVLVKKPKSILDPCIGPGTFYHQLRKISPNYNGRYSAVEIHPLLFEISAVSLYRSQIGLEIVYDDFLKVNSSSFSNRIEDSLAISQPKHLDSYIKPMISSGFDCIVCNPPYSRHHVISRHLKNEVGTDIESIFGGKFNRISSLFMYFILKSLMLLLKNGQMVFITPTISFESRNSNYLKKILKTRFRVPSIIVFHHSLNVFPGVDTAACIFAIDGRKPNSSDLTRLIVVKQWVPKEELLEILNTDNQKFNQWPNVEIYRKKQLVLDIESNWTNPRSFTSTNTNDKLVELSKFFKVMRGIATGNNDYFTLTEEQLIQYKIKREYVVPTITRTRYVQKYLFSEEDHSILRSMKRKVWLLNLHQERETIDDQELQKYIEYGLSLGVHKGSLVKTRKYWYCTEKRSIPYFIFTYLSRGNPRFILNEAQALPLNTFLMLYPKNDHNLTNEFLSLFWVILNSNTTIEALRDAGRCYGGDTLKIEPKEMMKAMIVNPFRISDDSRRKLLRIANDLRNIEASQKGDLITQIDTILDKELNSRFDSSKSRL
ncbi:MAG: class I SAM-dependent DNA methyltransferase, partial [Candidatus Hodarchaeota archaeon]